MAKEKNNDTLVAQNKKAYHDYFVDDTYEAGISLFGTEVKSVREGRINLKDSYVSVKTGEAFLIGAHISPYEKGKPINQLGLSKKSISFGMCKINFIVNF